MHLAREPQPDIASDRRLIGPAAGSNLVPIQPLVPILDPKDGGRFRMTYGSPTSTSPD